MGRHSLSCSIQQRQANTMRQLHSQQQKKLRRLFLSQFKYCRGVSWLQTVTGPLLLLSIYVVVVVMERTKFVVGANLDAHIKEQSSPSERTYEWQDWNYYRILDLPDPLATPGTSRPLDHNEDFVKTVRKAYREQSKRWHPDKQLRYVTPSNKTSAPSSTPEGTNATASAAISSDEAHARFVRISEAYQVLSDPAQKVEYDQYLRYLYQSTQQQQQQPRASSSTPSLYFFDDHQDNVNPTIFPSSYWDSATHHMNSAYGRVSQHWQDPWRLFEDIFASSPTSSTSGSSSADDSHTFNPSSFSFDSQSGFQHHQNQQQSEPNAFAIDPEPINVHEEESIGWDPISRQDILRITRTEDFRVVADPFGSLSASSLPPLVYFRTSVEDYVEDWDPYQRRWVYRALQAIPLVIEEGLRNGSDVPSDYFTYNQEQPFSSQEKSDAAILHSGESLTGDTVLRNGPYLLGLSAAVPDTMGNSLSRPCELWIVDTSWRLERDTDDFLINPYAESPKTERERYHLIWSSSENLPNSLPPRVKGGQSHHIGCHLELIEMQVALTHTALRWSGSLTSDVVWYSTFNESEDISDSEQDLPSPPVVARLDTDGSFTVYRIKRRIVSPCRFRFSWEPVPQRLDSTRPTLNLFRLIISHHARQFTRNLCRLYLVLLELTFQGCRPEKATNENEMMIERWQCMWTTNPLGCARTVRPLIRVLRSLHRIGLAFLSFLDDLIDSI